ncbi:MAG: hypothetical protein WDN09_00535 [bacterium]
MHNSYQSQLESFYSENRRMPSYSEMMDMFGLKSKNAIYKIVNKLVEAGMVAKDHLGRLVPTDTFAEDTSSVADARVCYRRLSGIRGRRARRYGEARQSFNTR